jgi:hypothetical protein
MNGVDFNPANHIKIAADSVLTLRRCDVYRVLDTAPLDHLADMAGYLIQHRVDLHREIEDCLDSLENERGVH